jgi:hypothetical protein
VVRFQHAALGFPPKATLLTTICHKNLATFPGLTSKNINKFFPESGETQKGHMKQTKQGVRSTKVLDEDAMLKAEAIPQSKPGVKHKDAYFGYLTQPKRQCTPISPAASHSLLPKDTSTQWWQSN